MQKRRVAFLFGGVSSEYEVSLISASSVISNTPQDRYEIFMIGITRDGKWLEYNGPVDLIAEDKWNQASYVTPAFISPDRSVHGFVRMGSSPSVQPLDAVFPVLHGKNGEDGTVQGLLEIAGIPYVGCGVLSCAVCMDKVIAKTITDAAGIASAAWQEVRLADLDSFDELEKELREKLGYPMYVKPANAGSSVGVSKAKDVVGLRDALELAFKHDKKAIVERAVTGQEIEVAVLGNDAPIASIVGEIAPSTEFYTYDSKYNDDTAALYVPARISDTASDAVRKTAVKIYRLLGCAGLCRVDFFLEKDTGRVIFNEANTIPGFTSISMYPKLFEATGIPYPDLIDRLFTFAIDRME